VAAGGVGARLNAASTRVQGDTGSVAYWLKRIVVFPIGERWALIAVLAMLTNGRVTLAVVVGFGLLAFAYTLSLRSLRSLALRVAVLDKAGAARHRDDGPVARGLLAGAGLPQPLAFAALAALAPLVVVVAFLAGFLAEPAKPALAVAGLIVLGAGLSAGARHDGPLDWLVPAALRAAEYLMVVAVGLAAAVPPPVVFLLLFTLALRHYDLTARMEKGAPPGRGGAAPTGWDVRVLVLVAFALAGLATLGMAVLAAGTGAAFVVKAVTDWRAGRS
jgi:hypothetical protein